MGIRIGILDEPEQQPFETELVKDVITLMTVFCARLYGKRRPQPAQRKGRDHRRTHRVDCGRER